MTITRKIGIILIVGVLLCSMLLPITTIKAETKTYNTPNTTTEDTDKKSECEVTADIHYAYYVSLPASLTLEPVDTVRDVKKWAEMWNMTESEILTSADEEGCYACWYQVKAKTKEGGLGGKYIKVVPKLNKASVIAYLLWKGRSQEEIDERIENGVLECVYFNDNDCYFNEWPFFNEDLNIYSIGTLAQKRIYFGNTASDKVVKVDSEKWSSIDGCVEAELENQGRYKGTFDFVYGLVDSID